MPDYAVGPGRIREPEYFPGDALAAPDPPPTEPQTPETITAALTHRCGLCGAKPGEHCRNSINGQPLEGRTVHWYRIEPAQ
jgi:hypothetical protein